MKYLRKLVTINRNADGKKFRTVSIPSDLGAIFPSDTVAIESLPSGMGIMILPVVGDQLRLLEGRKYVD